MTSHGVAITVWEELDSSQPGYKTFIEEVENLRIRRLAARLIAESWRCYKLHPTIKSTEATTFSGTGKMKRFLTSSLQKSITKSRKTKLSRSGVKRLVSIDPYPDAVVKLGQECYKYMEAATKLGERCMVQRCYVMMGGQKSEQFLQLRSLRHLAAMEMVS
jgi:hypothetical protein